MLSYLILSISVRSRSWWMFYTHIFFDIFSFHFVLYYQLCYFACISGFRMSYAITACLPPSEKLLTYNFWWGGEMAWKHTKYITIIRTNHIHTHFYWVLDETKMKFTNCFCFMIVENFIVSESETEFSISIRICGIVTRCRSSVSCISIETTEIQVSNWIFLREKLISIWYVLSSIHVVCAW